MDTHKWNRANRLAPILAAVLVLLFQGAIMQGERQMTVTTTTSRLSVFVNGDDARGTVLLLHGGPGVPDYLKEVAALFPEGYRTVRFDQRGTGGSAVIGRAFRLEDFVQDIDAILQALGVKRVHLFGHSWGGLLAQIYASSRPDRLESLFLASPSSGTGKVWTEMEREVFQYNRRKATGPEFLGLGLDSLFGGVGFDRAYQRMFSRVWTYYFLDPRHAPPAGKEWSEGIRASAVNGTRRSIIEFDDPAWEARLSNVKVPVLILYGAYDIYGGSKRYTYTRWPLARRVQMENAGHLPWIQQRDAFVGLLRDFYGK